MESLTLFSVLIALATTNAFYQLVPPDKETIFSWSANIKAGTHLPVPYASEYALQGKIHLQPYNNSIFVKFTDLTHRLYNGIIDRTHEHKTHNFSLVQEVQDLENIFKITYNKEGLVKGISTKHDEKEFSRNIKKAVASILQLNSSVFRKEYHRPESFTVKEDSIYGHGNDVYSIFPQSSDKLEIHKLHNMADNEDLYSYFVTNVEEQFCDVRIRKSVVHDSYKTYMIHKEEDSYFVQNISAMGSVGYYPFKARSDIELILVRQTFVLVEVVPAVEEYQTGNVNYEESSLKYRASFEKEDYTIFDETGGRRKIDFQKLIPSVQEMLKDITQYLREDHINTDQVDNKRGQLINRVQQTLVKFNIKKLQELQSTLTEDTLTAFYHVLPLIGSEASLLYIKTLIVTKTIDEDLATDLLQNIGGHIRPSIELVQNLEELIHLNSTYSWNLQKIAILSFGNIIYKSYLQQISSNSVDPQKPFEKYVDEYINNLRNSSSYIVQVSYLLGLRNMKLPILADRLIPAFNGEWWSNQNLKYMAIWSAAPSILLIPDKVIETYWPLFKNREEKLAVRAFAYFCIMYSRPSESLLRNVFVSMLTEPDEELYRIHFTLMETLVQSTYPCHKDIKLKLTPLLRFSRPPRGGTSEIRYFGYQDEEFGFSTGIQKHYLRSEDLRIYCYYVTSQLFYSYEEDWVVYWKIQDGRDKDPGLAQSIVDIIAKSQEESFDFHIEASIARRGQIINTFAFDKNSLHELISFLQFFVTNIPKWSKNMLYINHDRYNSYLIPTDLGFPAFWQYFKPELHYNNLTVHKDINGDKVELRVENKYGSWIHYRHGLTFYNPLADVWQGINRYHAYDSLLPLHFNLTVDFKLQNLQVYWQKQNDPSMNTAGFRTHTQQVVFVKDLDHEKIFLENKVFQTVGYDKEFKRDYPLLDKDILDTGHRLFVINYDSDIHAPDGVFKKRLLQYTDSGSKYFDSPLQQWILVWLHFHRDMILLPRPGSYGFVARLEPSHNFNVTNIDFVLHQKFDLLDKSYHVPGFNSYSHLTYSIKTQNKILKIWDLHVLVEVDTGHNFGKLKVKLSRRLPEEKDYNICIDGHKNWTTKEVRGYWSGFMGESNNGECGNDTMIEIKSIGKRSHEQEIGNYKKESCQYVIPYSAHNYGYMKCIISHTSLRDYSYEVTTTNVPPQLKVFLANFGDHLKTFFHSYFTSKIEHNENITKDSVRVKVRFPLEANEIDVEVATADQKYQFSGVPLKYWKSFYIAPDSTTYSLAFMGKYENGEIDQCVVRSDRRYLNRRHKFEVAPSEWTLYVGTDLKFHDHIYLKQINKKIAIRAVCNEHTVEIIPEPESDLHHIALDDSIISSLDHEEYWVHWSTFAEGIHRTVVIFLQESGIYIHYNVRQVLITIPEGNYWHGQCYAGVKPSLSPSTNDLGTKKKVIETLVPEIKSISPLINKIENDNRKNLV